MKPILKNKAFGSYLLVLAALLIAVSFGYYFSWGSGNNGLHLMITLGLILGFALNVLLFFLDSDWLVIATTIAYSVSLCQLLVNSVGSFADAFQGIVMFGDPTQVGTIINISLLISAGIIATIVSGFMQRVKN